MSLAMGAGMEARASELLSQPRSDFLLFTDVQFASQEWKDSLLWRTNKAKKSGTVFYSKLKKGRKKTLGELESPKLWDDVTTPSLILTTVLLLWLLMWMLLL